MDCASLRRHYPVQVVRVTYTVRLYESQPEGSPSKNAYAVYAFIISLESRNVNRKKLFS